MIKLDITTQNMESYVEKGLVKMSKKEHDIITDLFPEYYKKVMAK
ncbi:hypothetical protein PPTG_22043 [Phytophthora nicotianae INRA-310]|uniref:Uncharacterized protein n=3 Tax=Phytophthora nicotianae TaxID=4792 RepID=W2QP59_PHYN3|nr:hypothetical protein PPTG_22043 [Phytophthora nicotianae INRA-310]ETI54878.1 hypothetical protein F443_02378 [Phytophthora nicotianae P1569]ETM54399.1 hypothetical protein L914_02257 [Phytophthora nicotianae]ETN14977.1 hypothetical protein PPTG_22043 [Phytophthora nicotianae INRA-310]